MTELKLSPSKKKIVVIGGGNGSYIVGKGLRDRNVRSTILSTPADSGGDSGDIRDELGEMLPPGDMRRGVIALIESRYSAQLTRLLDVRIHIGNNKMRSVGNFLISAAMEEFGSIEGLKLIEELLHVQGTVLPMSIDDVQLHGRLNDGSLLESETVIDTRPLNDERILTEVWLEPSAHICREAAEAILEADLITIGPGDLFTSIAPNLLVRGVADVLKESGAKLVAIPSLMTKWSETRDYQVHDFVRKMVNLGIGREKFDYAIVNTTEIPSKILENYLTNEKSTPMLVRNRSEMKMLKESVHTIFGVDLLSRQGLRKGYPRHDPRKVAHAIMDILDPSRARIPLPNSESLEDKLRVLGRKETQQ